MYSRSIKSLHDRLRSAMYSVYSGSVETRCSIRIINRVRGKRGCLCRGIHSAWWIETFDSCEQMCQVPMLHETSDTLSLHLSFLLKQSMGTHLALARAVEDTRAFGADDLTSFAEESLALCIGFEKSEYSPCREAIITPLVSLLW